MKISDEVVVAYVDGELDADTRAAVDAELLRDAALAQAVQAHRTLRQRLGSALNIELSLPVPARLLDVARNAPAGMATVTDLSSRPRVLPGPRWVALAASLMIGGLLGTLAWQGWNAGPLALREGQLVARGTLARALNGQQSGPQAGTPLQIGLSFRDRDAHYCRTFVMGAVDATAGLACRDAGRWTVLATAPASMAGAAGGLRMAATVWPDSILAAVQARIAGESLDAEAEARAMKRDWSP